MQVPVLAVVLCLLLQAIAALGELTVPLQLRWRTNWWIESYLHTSAAGQYVVKFFYNDDGLPVTLPVVTYPR